MELPAGSANHEIDETGKDKEGEHDLPQLQRRRVPNGRERDARALLSTGPADRPCHPAKWQLVSVRLRRLWSGNPNAIWLFTS
jgi:hypothetical protein